MQADRQAGRQEGASHNAGVVENEKRTSSLLLLLPSPLVPSPPPSPPPPSRLFSRPSAMPRTSWARPWPLKLPAIGPGGISQSVSRRALCKPAASYCTVAHCGVQRLRPLPSTRVAHPPLGKLLLKSSSRKPPLIRGPLRDSRALV